MTAPDDEGRQDRDGSQDPWVAARARSREDVRAAFAPRDTTCPACGARTKAATRTCPACGAALVGLRRRRRPSRRLVAVLVAVAGCVAVALGVIISDWRSDADAERAAAARAQEALEAREARRLEVLGRPVRVQGPRPAGRPTLADRERLVAAGERAVVAQARRVEPTETFRTGSCRPTPTGPRRSAQERDLGVDTNRYACIAVERRIEFDQQAGASRVWNLGVPFWLVADYRTGALTLCRRTLKPGEGGKALAVVGTAPACQDPLR